MTKLKSKKMTKSTLAIIIMGIAIVALLAFGGSFAYFTASTRSSGTATFTTGIVRLNSTGIDTVINRTGVLPGDTLANAVVLNTTGATVDTFVAVQFAFTAGNSGLTLAVNTAAVTIGSNSGYWVEVEKDNTPTGIYVLCTEQSGTTPIAVPADTTGINVTSALTIATSAGDSTPYLETESQPNIMGAQVTLSINAKSIQTTHLSESTVTSTTVAALLYPAVMAD